MDGADEQGEGESRFRWGEGEEKGGQATEVPADNCKDLGFILSNTGDVKGFEQRIKMF